MNEQILNNNDYLNMNAGDETGSEYLSMKSRDDRPVSNPLMHYDNLGTVRSVDGRPVPAEPMEAVPMIQLDTYEKSQWCVPTPLDNDYLRMNVEHKPCLLESQLSSSSTTDQSPPPSYNLVVQKF